MSHTSLCGSCREGFPPAHFENSLVHIDALFSYSDQTVKRAIWALKYKGDREIAHLFAEMLYDHVLALIEESTLFTHIEKPPIVLPIPLSWKKRWRRGFNQMDRIASELSKLDGERTFEVYKTLLKKRVNTKSQVEVKNRKQRIQNAYDSFEVTLPKAVQGRYVIIIDDVVTTGGTLQEAMRVLKLAGAKKVIGLAIAH